MSRRTTGLANPVYRMILAGRTNREIVLLLNCDRNTVARYRAVLAAELAEEATRQPGPPPKLPAEPATELADRLRLLDEAMTPPRRRGEAA